MKKSRKLRAGENLFAWLMMIFSLFVFIEAYRISGFSSISSPGMYPMIAAAVMVLSMALILLNNRKLVKPDADGFKDEMQLAARRVLPPIFLIYTAIVVGYMSLIEPLHFLPSSLVFLMASMIYLKGGSWLKSVLIAVGTMAGIYLIFQYVFRVVLP
jgi:putative tricarboxylic transport membrane protein